MEVPCGRTTGHGESCTEGWLCEHCEEITELREHLHITHTIISRLLEENKKLKDQLQQVKDLLSEDDLMRLEK